MGTTLHSAPNAEARKDTRLKLLDAKIRSAGAKPEALIEVLHTAQGAYGYLPLPVLAYISKALHLPPSRVYATVSFYHFFSLQAKGEHRCLVCTGTACYVKGAQQVLQAVEQAFQLKAGQVTADGKLGLQVARCVGACGLAPVALVDDVLQAKADGAALVRDLKQLTG